MGARDSIFAVYVVFYWLVFVLSDRGARRALAHSRALQEAEAPLPSVTIIKPVRGVDDFTRENFLSWLDQDYQGYLQYVFSLQEPGDPAIPLIEELRRVRPERTLEILVNPVVPGMGGKSSNLHHAIPHTCGEVLVLSDADIRAEPQAVSQMVGELQRGTGLVSCLPLHRDARGFWARLYALIWNSALLGFWAGAMLSGRAPGVAGGTVAIRRSDLDRLGGVEAFAPFIAEDLELGRLARSHGLKLGLGPVVVSPVGRMSLGELWQKCLRANLVVLHQGRYGKLKTLALYLLVYGYWALLLLGLLTSTKTLVFTAAALAGARAVFLAVLPVRAGSRATPLPLFLAADLLMIAALGQAMFRPIVRWGGVDLRVETGGRTAHQE